MTIKNNRPNILLIKIIILTLIASAIPLNQLLIYISPIWVLLFFIYWLVYTPAKYKFFIALLLGLIIDVLEGLVLGQNALALILSSAFIIHEKQSFFVSNLTTQQIYVFVAASIYLSTVLLIHFLIQGVGFNWFILSTPLSSAIFWPLIKIILVKLHH